MADRKDAPSFGIIPLRFSQGKWHIFLVLHKGENHWGFPKGRSKEKESPLESAIRELREETGLKVERLLDATPISEEYVYQRDGQEIAKEVHYFPALVSGALLLHREEIQDGKWLLMSEAFSQLTFTEAKKVLEWVETRYCR